MPKKVDHTERRDRIAGAIWTLTASGGLDALTMRNVAAAAGMSLGLLQHYFPTKERLLELAFDLVRERALAQVTAPTRQDGEEDDSAAGQPVYRALVALLPLDEAREPAARATLGQLALASRHTHYAVAQQKTHAELHALLVTELRVGQRRGEVALDRNVDEEARTLLALVAGLTAHVLAGTETSDGADGVLRHHVERLFSE